MSLLNLNFIKFEYKLTNVYGFKKNSFEADTTPRAESFWQFFIPIKAKNWLKQLEFEKM